MENATGQLLELIARAEQSTEPQQLRGLLRDGHRLWCEGLAEIRTHTFRQCRDLDDAGVAEHCRRRGSPWETGHTRSEAVSHLAFAIWDASPAAMAYATLEARASAFGVSLLDEE